MEVSSRLQGEVECDKLLRRGLDESLTKVIKFVFKQYVEPFKKIDMDKIFDGTADEQVMT